MARPHPEPAHPEPPGRPGARRFPEGADRAQLIERTLAQYRRYLNPGLARLFQFGGVETVEWAAEGCLVWDVHGREYIDRKSVV